MPSPATKSDTRERLLAVAAEVFAEKGYELASVREICTRAGANVAAINYHFGDKRTLYNSLLDTIFRQSWALRTPFLPADAPPAARLLIFIRSFFEELLECGADDGERSRAARLYLMEMARPSEALDQIVRDHISRDAAEIEAIVTALLGPAADPGRVAGCAASVVGQMLYYLHAAPIIERLAPEAPPPREQLDALVEHVYQFSLGGIARLSAHSNI